MKATIEIDWTEEEIGELWDVVADAAPESQYWANLTIDSFTNTITVQDGGRVVVIDPAHAFRVLVSVITPAAHIRGPNLAIRQDAFAVLTLKDTGYLDATLADVVLQMAMFGELVYG